MVHLSYSLISKFFVELYDFAQISKQLVGGAEVMENMMKNMGGGNMKAAA